MGVLLLYEEVQSPAFAKIVPRPKWPQVRECPCLAELRVVGRCKFKRAERADMVDVPFAAVVPTHAGRSEEHTSELQSLMRISYAVFCLKKKNKPHDTQIRVPTTLMYRDTNE